MVPVRVQLQYEARRRLGRPLCFVSEAGGACAPFSLRSRAVATSRREREFSTGRARTPGVIPGARGTNLECVGSAASSAAGVVEAHMADGVHMEVGGVSGGAAASGHPPAYAAAAAEPAVSRAAALGVPAGAIG